MSSRASLALVTLALAATSCARTPPTLDDQTHDAAPVPAPTLSPAVAPATGETWNATQVDWQPYESGLQKAKDAHKPVCLVFYTTWCPHCRNYSHVFDDPRVVERARDFVMIRLDADAEATVAAKYQVDGGYIPRTYFLAPDGTLDRTIHAPRARAQYFYDERDPGSLLAGMSTALQKLVR